jgi:hypothetical protein
MEPPTPMLLDEDPGGDGAAGGDGRCDTWPCVGVLASILLYSDSRRRSDLICCPCSPLLLLTRSNPPLRVHLAWVQLCLCVVE